MAFIPFSTLFTVYLDSNEPERYKFDMYDNIQTEIKTSTNIFELEYAGSCSRVLLHIGDRLIYSSKEPRGAQGVFRTISLENDKDFRVANLPRHDFAIINNSDIYAFRSLNSNKTIKYELVAKNALPKELPSGKIVSCYKNYDGTYTVLIQNGNDTYIISRKKSRLLKNKVLNNSKLMDIPDGMNVLFPRPNGNVVLYKDDKFFIWTKSGDVLPCELKYIKIANHLFRLAFYANINSVYIPFTKGSCPRDESGRICMILPDRRSVPIEFYREESISEII
ncbi:MAG TPA: hypothetical protein PK390_06430 [Fervidobacterium nodosum]|nr:hypothetical protein [Fervidobacterium nodosum]